MRQPVLFLVSFLFLSLLIGFNLYYSFHHFGELVYPLDDAYIHMAISKNLQQHGVWGITRFEFSSTSSSILYTLLLSLGFSLTGISIWLPLIINLLTAAAILWLFTTISLRFMRPTTAMFFNLLLVAIVPISGMVMLGMEHSLQILFCALFLWQTWKNWQGEKLNGLVYALTATLAVATRYESAFLVGWIGLIYLFIDKKWTLLLGICIAFPICIFGWYAISHGGFFLPNSLIAKSNYVNTGITGFIAEASKKILFNSLLASLILLPFIYWLLWPVRTFKDLRNSSIHLLMLVIALTAISHQVLASFGWMFRYEAYLVALLFLGIAISWNNWKQLWIEKSAVTIIVGALLMAVILFPLLSRLQIPVFTNRAMKNIHDQQLQMAGFVGQYFPSSGVAMNDIGTTSFYNNDIRIFDMEGLGTLDVLRIKKQFDSSWLERYASGHNINIGIFYPHLYKGKIPASWIKVGSWEITDRFVAAGSEVGFYAFNPSDAAKLKAALADYKSKLPRDVVQKSDQP